MDRFKKAKIRSISSTLDPLVTIQLIYLDYPSQLSIRTAQKFNKGLLKNKAIEKEYCTSVNMP